MQLEMPLQPQAQAQPQLQPQTNNVVNFRDYIKIGRIAEAYIRADYAAYCASEDDPEKSTLQIESSERFSELFNLIIDE